MLPIHTILHPTDFSEHSRAAFQAACMLAAECDAHLVVLHVVEPPSTVLGGYPSVPASPDAFQIPAAEKMLYRVTPSDPTLNVDHRLEIGYPAEEILRVAKELGADLIVLGTHGRRGVGRLLMGSVAEQVLRNAECPVLTMKQPIREGVSTPPKTGIKEAAGV